MGQRKLAQNARARTREMHNNLPPVVCARHACYVTVIFQTIHQLHHAVMLELQASGQLADGGLDPVRQPPDSEQKLVLLRLQAEAAGLLLAEMHKSTYFETELRQGAVFGQR